MAAASKFSILDVLLLLMAVIWGTNYPVIKSAFRELNPQAFNAVRMLIASIAFLTVMAILRRGAGGGGPNAAHSDIAGIFHTPAPVTWREWLHLAGLGVVGHALYQYFFIGGLARTSVANSSLLLAATPVLIALISALGGRERLGSLHWLGASVSVLGIYLVVGQGAALGGAGLTGDLMMLGAICCWAVYTLGAGRLMVRHSPVGVTGLSMSLGTLVYFPVMWPEVRAVEWTAVTPWTLSLLVYSACFALCVSYTIWYVGVRQIGSARTSVYANLVPLVAMGSAAIFLREPVGLRKALGAAAVLAGVALTRIARADTYMPSEE
jgi:drug/metabolite transporter (DMT)-like permease